VTLAEPLCLNANYYIRPVKEMNLPRMTNILLICLIALLLILIFQGNGYADGYQVILRKESSPGLLIGLLLALAVLYPELKEKIRILKRKLDLNH